MRAAYQNINQKKWKHKMKRIAYITFQSVLWILTLISIAGLLLSSFGGYLQPNELKGVSLMILTMPAWIVLLLIMTILDVLWCRKALPLCILCFIACANSIYNYCPLNIFGPNEKKYADCPKFTLLTYNIASFNDLTKEYPGGINPTVSYILGVNADVVCLQETEVTLSKPFKPFHITAEQIDSVNSLYPFRIMYGGFLMVMSKYPIEAIHTPPLDNDPRSRWDLYPIGVYRLNIEGLPVTLFDVHLQSYGLSREDKTLYKNIAEGKEIIEAAEGSVKKSLSDINKELIGKVQTAYEKRGRESEALCRYIEKFGGPNVIVAGDFNDVPGCYVLNQLADYKMKQVYPELGFGPMITFNADMFYFRIDHILYRGNLKPLKIVRGSIKSSDHYPLICQFAITDNNSK